MAQLFNCSGETAVLGLLSNASEERPLVCVVDDAQWMDRASAQVLGFVARRLLAESVVLVFGARERAQELLGLPELEVTGLGDADADTLLNSVTHARLDQQIRDRIVAETEGNPLALLELPRGPTVTQTAGGFGLLHADTLPGRIEQSFLSRIEALPEQTRLLLLVAAAEPVGDPALVWRAAGRLGVTPAAALAGGTDGLLSFDVRVTFRHPLVRSAVYRSATEEDRGRAHLASGGGHRSAGRPGPPRLAPRVRRGRARRARRRRTGTVRRPCAGARWAGRRGGVPAAIRRR